ncbi:uncharacterized protein EV154DRAFT_556509 [Mucor mucedo]|uniref:uncharacterized protein n=1 Tax=Mucor mucedo TaxID=29922 RepID=UPI0022207088|nr:uncharacterized protein EV154DRAFT_556509 [Mucor mucedo]KAI7871982.1 hypothetical protein EV154DRAFT_556509 [Mucor mucedo]
MHCNFSCLADSKLSFRKPRPQNPRPPRPTPPPAPENLANQSLIAKTLKTIVKKCLICYQQMRQKGDNAWSIYSAKPTEWPDGTKSDTLYTAAVSSPQLPPVLIEVQQTITFEFIDKLIMYSLWVKKQYQAKPIVVVFGTRITRHPQGIRKTNFFSILGKRMFVFGILYIARNIEDCSSPPFGSCGVFFSSKSLSLSASDSRDNRTIQMLYQIVKDESMTRVNADKSTSEVLLKVCYDL